MARHLLITKGALRQMLEVSSRARAERRLAVPIEPSRAEVERQWRQFSNEGHRVLGVAYRELRSADAHHARSDEAT